MTAFLSKSRGIRNLVTRTVTILTRFGFSSRRFRRKLDRFGEVARSLGCVPTLAITAVTLKRHPEPIRDLSRRGVEFAVHGYMHTDYRSMDRARQVRHLRKAMQVFERYGVPFTGFRAPFLRLNGNAPAVIGRAGFDYDSSSSIHWNVLDRSRYSDRFWNDYCRVLDFYQARQADEYLSLPRTVGDFVEIPVSIPDDETMIDRLGAAGLRDIADAWLAILAETHDRGELFTVQLHPERITLCEGALTDTLKRSRQLVPQVWVATLREISRWWKEKDGFALAVEEAGAGRYHVRAACSERATLLVRNCRTGVPVEDWARGYRLIAPREFSIESPARPTIGVAPDTSPVTVAFLRSEGYVVEDGMGARECGIRLDGLSCFQESDEKPLVARIEASDAPLVRFWRWPDRSRSALSVTGDIDAMTLADFALRIVENWRRDSI